MGAARVLLGMLACWGCGAAAESTCPGSIDIPGFGQVALVNAERNVPGEPVGPVEVRHRGGRRAVAPGERGRTYFGESCANGTHNPSRYTAVPLLGRTLRFTTDISWVGCGCNAALYLVSLQQNSRVSRCFASYCDADSVCGVPCAEIDLQEANMHAWHSTLHTADDGSGIGAGYGGGESWDGHRDWTMEDYAPNGICIETSKPFQVAVSAGMTTIL